jgi:hypothetical protein
MLRRLRGPEAEAVVMFRRENDRAKVRGLCGARPLPRVERAGIENARRLLAVAPFAIGEGVDAEMEEQRQLVALPLKLRHRRPRQRDGKRRGRRPPHNAAGESGGGQ